MKRILTRTDYQIPPTELAVKLLGKVFVGPNGASGRIIETEAYGGENDPASHGNRGETPRNKVMFGEAGYLYVYFTYGMHYCTNIVAGEKGECAAALIRALEPLDGLKKMKRARLKTFSKAGKATKTNTTSKPKKIKDSDLCSGPAKLAQALGITTTQNGTDLTLALTLANSAYLKTLNPKINSKNHNLKTPSSDKLIYIYDDGFTPIDYQTSPRIGISSGLKLPWRYFL